VFISSSNTLPCIHIPRPALATSLRQKRDPLTRPQYGQRLWYAVIARGHSRYDHKKLPWPEVTSVNAIPTPYQIFNQKKGSAYSKQRFYELVKIYHPDRHNLSDSIDGLSYQTKVERYRLVIAANDILSDPIKRAAFDTYGAGWNGSPGVVSPGEAREGAGTWGSYSGRGWDGGPRGPSQNATWEDWEKWYRREAGAKQEPTYFSNITFVALIVFFAAIGGLGQVTRVGNYSLSLLEQRDAIHDEMSRELNRRRRESENCSNREERIQNFLKQRDPFGYGITDSLEEQYRKSLPDPGICSSEDMKSRSMDVYCRKEGNDEKK